MELPVALGEPRGHTGAATRSAAVLLFGASAAQAMMAVALLIVARHLGADAYGRYTASFSACTLSAVLFSFGLDSWLLREGARRPADRQRSLGEVLAFKLVLGLPWLLILGVVLPAVAPRSFPRSLVVVAAVATLADGIFTAYHAAFKSSLRNTATATTLLVSRGLILVGAVAMVYAGARNDLAYAIARLAAVAIGLAVAVGMAGVGPLRTSIRRLVALGREAAAFAVNDLLAIVYAQADIVIVAIALSSRDAGLYSPASSLINALFVVPSAIYSVATPVLVRHLAARDGERLRHEYRRAMLAFAAIGVALTVATALSAQIVVPRLLGPGFLQSGPLLVLLSPILLLKSLSFGVASLLVAVGWQRERAIVQGASMVANIALNLLLVWRYGITVVALVYVVSEVVLLAGYLVLSRRWWRRAAVLVAEGAG
ncbi:MAG: oligosaccharide flippase family protein [Anaerolineae bacterium]